MTGQLLDPQPKLTRLSSPKAKEMISTLRLVLDGRIEGDVGSEYWWREILTILDELNEQEMSRG